MAKKKSVKALRTKYKAAPKKRKPTEGELANDPSLRWCGYRRFELVWSDTHKTEMRFVEYLPNGKVRLANMMLGIIPGEYNASSIRRPTARPVDDSVWAGKYGGGPRPKS